MYTLKTNVLDSTLIRGSRVTTLKSVGFNFYNVGFNTISFEYPTLSKRLESDNTFYEMLESKISVFRVKMLL